MRTIAAVSFFMGIGFGYAIDYFVHWLGKRQNDSQAFASSNDEIELADMEDQDKGNPDNPMHCHGDLNLTNISLVTALAVGFHNLPGKIISFPTVVLK